MIYCLALTYIHILNPKGAKDYLLMIFSISTAQSMVLNQY